MLTRRWNHRDAERTKVTAATRNAAFLLESALGVEGLPLMNQTVSALVALLTPKAEQVSHSVLGPAHADSVLLESVITLGPLIGRIPLARRARAEDKTCRSQAHGSNETTIP